MSTTREVFDEIAPEWYNRRHRSIFTKELEELARRWRGGRLLNVGCGHGPDFVPFKKGFELYGIDISRKMLELAGKYAEKYNLKVNLIQADAREMPFSNDFFDYAIAVASLHHIEGEDNHDHRVPRHQTSGSLVSASHDCGHAIRRYCCCSLRIRRPATSKHQWCSPSRSAVSARPRRGHSNGYERR